MGLRLLLFMASIWLIFEDISKKGFNYMYFTTWGAYCSSLSLFLMFLCSVERFHKICQIRRRRELARLQPPQRIRAVLSSQLREGAFEMGEASSKWLWKSASFMF
mmetsp:Transcript_16048/g.27064  ORF Transcript_16048/g.27064 Transcript_16048/m.27064 type:complete len:105 (-) Transcript_16048:602-916(-)